MSGIPKTADLIQEMYDEIRADLQEEINAQEEISQLSDLHVNDSVAPSGNSHLGRRTNTHSEPGNLTGMCQNNSTHLTLLLEREDTLANALEQFNNEYKDSQANISEVCIHSSLFS
jgi:hypothetical protein